LRQDSSKTNRKPPNLKLAIRQIKPPETWDWV
jgi:hypothetical protein